MTELREPLALRAVDRLEELADDRPEQLAGLGLLALAGSVAVGGRLSTILLVAALLMAVVLVALPLIRRLLRVARRKLVGFYLASL